MVRHRYKNNTPLSTSTSTSTFFKTRTPSYTYTFILHLLLSTLALSSHAAERHWVGTTSTSASVAANWAENVAPADGDTVILDADSADKPMTWNLAVSPGGWTQTNYAGTVTFDRGTNAVVMSGDVDLASGKWTHTANPSFSSSSYEWTSGRGSKHLVVRTSGNFTLQGGASIDVTGMGFRRGEGPAGTGSTGASHGGTSSISDSKKNVPAGYGSSRCPETIGSAGGGNSSWGAPGGGAIYIAAGKRMRLDGKIAADACPYTNNDTTSKPQYYGGAGGSVWLVAGSLFGTGAVHAVGTTVSACSAGGGGRIAVHLKDSDADFSSFTGSFSAARGRAPTNTGDAFPGTIYRETKADENRGELVVDGAGASTAKLEHPKMGRYGTYVGNEATQYYSRITLKWPAQLVIPSGVRIRTDEIASENGSSYTNRIVLRGGTLELPKDTAISNFHFVSIVEGSRLGFFDKVDGVAVSVTNTTVVEATGILEVDGPFSTLSNLEVRAGGKVTHCAGSGLNGVLYAMDLVVPGDVRVHSGGAINVNGCGYGKGAGTGKGTVNNTGASHGGVAWADYKATGYLGNGIVYGSVRYPTDHGSGGTWTSTEGGGAMRVRASGTFRNDGVVSADGATCQYHSGSGGSVWLTAARLTGSGKITAHGGYVTIGGGSGGGGRIAVYLTESAATFDDYAGSIAAYGGNAKGTLVRGGPGTVYLETAAQGTANGTLVVDNGSQACTDKSTAGLVSAKIGDDVTDAEVGDVRIVGKRSRLSVADGYALSFSGTWTNASFFVAESNSAVVARDASRPGFVYGTNDFCNFTCTIPGKTLSFGCLGSLLSVTKGGVLTFTGDDDSSVFLNPAVAGETWCVCVCEDAGSDVSHVVVSNSNAMAGMIIVAKSSTGNMDEETSNWRFQNVVRGAVITWTGSINDAWGNPSNWDLGREPTETDNIVIAAAGTPPVASKPIAAWSLTVESGASLSLAGYDVAVSNLTVSGTLTAGGAETIAVTKDATFAGGTFECARSTLLLEGEGNQTFAPAGIKFNNVQIEKGGGTLSVGGGFSAERFYTAVSAPVTIAFQRDSLVTARQVAFDGLVDNAACLTLESSVSGASWKIVAKAFARASGVTVSDSDATGGLAFRTISPSTVTRSANWSVLTSTFTWTGTSDSNFTNAANWAGGVAPGADDSVSIAGPATLTLKTPWTVRDLALGGGEGAVTFTGSAALTVAGQFEIATNATVTLNIASSVGGTLVIRNGGKLTHSANGATAAYGLNLSVGGDVIIEEGGSVDVRGRGYGKGYGPGYGNNSNGASHGGLGLGNERGIIAPAYGFAFGPTALGSGGSSDWIYGSAGGGMVVIETCGDFALDGSVNANAYEGVASTSGVTYYGYYTGSGGSVWLRAASLTGIGSITVTGGDVAEANPGGGGRIAVWLTGAETPSDTLTITAYGGRRIAPPAVYCPTAGAGTVYVQGASQTERHGTIRIDNDGGSGMTPFPVDDAGTAPYRSATFVVTAGGKLSLTNDLTIGDLDLSASGKVYLNGHTLSVVSRAHRRELQASEAAGRIVKGGGALVFARRGLMILAR